MRFSTQYFYNLIIDKQFIATRHKSKKIKEEAIANPLPFKKNNHLLYYQFYRRIAAD